MIQYDTLDRDFTLQLVRLATKYGEQFELLNGFHKSQLNFSSFIGNFIDKSTADASIDANANASAKDVRSLMNEMSKPELKLFCFNKLYYEMKKFYGKRTADEWLEDEYSGAEYLHNSYNSTLVPYCYAASLKRLAEEGMFFLDNYKPKPPQHLSTFVSFVREYVATMSTQSSGATGLPDFLVWAFYFWRKDVASGDYMRNPEYYAKQCFQNLIFTLNQKCLRIVEPAFTNMSITDRFYAQDLFGGIEYPNGEMFIDHLEEFMQFQKWFMEVFTEIKHTEVFAFPVISYCLLFKDGKFQDEEFARWCSDHNCLYYDSNFFQASMTNILSNCCFSGEQTVLVRNSQIHDKEFIATFKQLAGMMHEHSIVDYEVYSKGEFKPAKLIELPARPMKEVILVDGKRMIVTDNHINVTKNGLKHTADLTLQDQLMVYEDEEVKYVKIKIILDYHMEDKHVYCFEMDDKDNPYFTLANGIVTHNCRLLSDTKKLNAFINSIGGSALSVGSIQVNTINLRRIAYELDPSNYTEEAYLKLLRDRVILCCKILHVQRHTIIRTHEKGLLPMFCDGGFDFSRMYSTIGM